MNNSEPNEIPYRDLAKNLVELDEKKEFESDSLSHTSAELLGYFPPEQQANAATNLRKKIARILAWRAVKQEAKLKKLIKRPFPQQAREALHDKTQKIAQDLLSLSHGKFRQRYNSTPLRVAKFKMQTLLGSLGKAGSIPRRSIGTTDVEKYDALEKAIEAIEGMEGDVQTRIRYKLHEMLQVDPAPDDDVFAGIYKGFVEAARQSLPALVDRLQEKLNGPFGRFLPSEKSEISKTTGRATASALESQ